MFLEKQGQFRNPKVVHNEFSNALSELWQSYKLPVSALES